ncbi:MAG: DUF805 domain-containing protein [Bacteroidales bacterium]|jgi:uncharacterized membrane protein YhaH (DUF805 family)|nr:DUF805 domain-containing protein [Bacteroidales bacterium]
MNTNLGWKIFGLFVSIFLIIGGLSGEMVLRGTDSSTALVVAGFVFLVLDIFAIATHKKQKAQEENVADDLQLEADVRHEPTGSYDEDIRDEEVLSDESFLPPQRYSGIQWFFKALRHYADFSGRARRREYWWFVLFNFISAFLWSFLLMLVFALTGRGDVEYASNIVALSFYLVFLLPAMAVAVRRLHDLGKSGWMLLVMFIPLVGGIWLLVLMLTEGQQGANKYGPDPKTSSDPFSEAVKVKSAGVAFIVAASLAIVTSIIQFFAINSLYGSFPFWGIVNFIVLVITLLAGIFLLNGKTMNVMHEKTRYAFFLFLAAVSISLIISVISLKNYLSNVDHIQWRFAVNSSLNLLYKSLIILFTALFLFLQEKKYLIRNIAVLVIVFSGLFLFWDVYNCMVRDHYGSDIWEQILNFSEVFYLLQPIAYIILAGTYLSGMGVYLSGTEQSVPVYAPVIPRDTESAPAKDKSPVFSDSAPVYYTLEHKVGSRYHRTGEKQEISNEQVEIGRDPGCEVRFDEHFETVSRRHAAIIKEGNHWKLIPVSQTNPTFINGRRVHKEWYLQNGDEIQCAMNGPVLVFRLPG